MRIVVDKTVNAAYLTLSYDGVANTVEFQPDVLVDVDDNGTVVGVEVLGVDTVGFDMEAFEKAFGVSKELAYIINAGISKSKE